MKTVVISSIELLLYFYEYLQVTPYSKLMSCHLKQCFFLIYKNCCYMYLNTISPILNI
jgi:hypothetical protein